ncbi:MAG: hypothetical protein WCF23_22105 [Candidatus Nitrosopolaris sp.]
MLVKSLVIAISLIAALVLLSTPIAYGSSDKLLKQIIKEQRLQIQLQQRPPSKTNKGHNFDNL